MRPDESSEDVLLAAFRAAVRDDSRAPALVDAANRCTTRKALLARAEDRAAELRGRLSPGTLLALSAPPGPGYVEAFLAARIAGLPVALLDHAGPRPSREAAARGLGAALAWFPGADEPFAEGAAAPAAPEALADTAVIKVTSGSTGSPKGVRVSAPALYADTAHLVRAIGLGPDDRGLCVLPLSHSYGLSVLLIPLLVRGIPIVFPGDAPPLEVARHTGATFLPSVPAWFRALLALEPSEAWRGPLRVLMTAGAPLSAELAREIRQHTGLGVHVLYGASEVGAITYDTTGTGAERGAVGQRIEGVDVTLDEADGRVVVRSPGAGLGPWPLPADGADPDDALADGTFRAADRAEWVDGELVLRGRVDRVINVRGKKVDPTAVERALEALDDVQEAVVLGVELPHGRGTAVRAVVAARAGATPRAADLLRSVSTSLAPHEVPRGVVVVDALPRTVRGKLDRAAVRELAEGKSALSQ